MCGASADQDTRIWSNKERLLIKEMERKNEFPWIYQQKVDINNISIEKIKPWIETKIAECQGEEDEIAVGYCIAQLEAEQKKKDGAYTMDPKRLQLYLKGVLHQNAELFCHALWQMLLEEQERGGSRMQTAEEKRYEMKMKLKKEEAAHPRSIEDQQRRSEYVAQDESRNRSSRDGGYRSSSPRRGDRSSRRTRDDGTRRRFREDDSREPERHGTGGSSSLRRDKALQDESRDHRGLTGRNPKRYGSTGNSSQRRDHRAWGHGERKMQGPRRVSRSRSQSRSSSQSQSPTRSSAPGCGAVLRQGEQSRFSDGPPVPSAAQTQHPKPSPPAVTPESSNNKAIGPEVVFSI